MAATTISNAAATTVTMSANVAGSGVGNGNSIQYQANNNSAAGIAWQNDLYTDCQGNSNLVGTAVLNFTDYPGVGLAGTADFNNAHIYSTYGSQPYFQYGTQYGQSLSILGLAQLVTATGWYTANNGNNRSRTKPRKRVMRSTRCLIFMSPTMCHIPTSTELD